MQSRQIVKQLVFFALITLGVSACAIQGASGVISLALGSSLLTLLLLFVGSIQSGCELSQVHTCLSPPISGEMEAGEIGPCLSPPLAGDEMPAGDIGPCLSQIPPDMSILDEGVAGAELDEGVAGAELDEGVAGAELDEGVAGVESDFGVPELDEGVIGPCLSPPAPDMNPRPEPDRPDQKERASSKHSEKTAIIARLSKSNTLPADILARLKH